ncbi:hypothetical protein LX64_00899 [Chitinophaga skermanii]|uniref:Uncharacterized protein n=1 Tax=Chitinophaga skermanii TaxID=331697 RepID=A0A327QXA2_9BACT|nr:putative zinc-binding metallopeptidase [Chitinophaga skermanii]RAJ08252.1 hypothetical protein LX64_00899 [Chitinophaga skermanii]
MKKYALFLLVVVMAACSKEDKLTPSPVKPLYQIPQGNQPYDDTIVKLYGQYKTYILYKYTHADFAYNLLNNRTDSAQAPNLTYVPNALEMLRKGILNKYPEAFLQKTMPQKILLASSIGNTGKPSASNFAATISAMTIGWCDSTLVKQTPENMRFIYRKMNRAYFERLMLANIITVPADFSALAYTSYDVVGPVPYALGIVEPPAFGNNQTTDFLGFVEHIMGYTKSELDATILSASVDKSGKIKKKYAIVVKFFLDNYNFDLQAIGNAS